MLIDNIIKNFDCIEKYILVGCDLDVWENLRQTERGKILLWAVYFYW